MGVELTYPKEANVSVLDRVRRFLEDQSPLSQEMRKRYCTENNVLTTQTPSSIPESTNKPPSLSHDPVSLNRWKKDFVQLEVIQ